MAKPYLFAHKDLRFRYVHSVVKPVITKFGHSRFTLRISHFLHLAKAFLKLVSSWCLESTRILSFQQASQCFFLLNIKFCFDHCIEWLCFSEHGNVDQVYIKHRK